MKFVRHSVTSTAIPSPVGEIRMTCHCAWRQLAQQTQQTCGERFNCHPSTKYGRSCDKYWYWFPCQIILSREKR